MTGKVVHADDTPLRITTWGFVAPYRTPANVPLVPYVLTDALPTWVLRAWRDHWRGRLWAARTPGHWAAARDALALLHEQIGWRDD